MADMSDPAVEKVVRARVSLLFMNPPVGQKASKYLMREGDDVTAIKIIGDELVYNRQWVIDTNQIEVTAVVETLTMADHNIVSDR